MPTSFVAMGGNGTRVLSSRSDRPRAVLQMEGELFTVFGDFEGLKMPDVPIELIHC